MEAWTHGGLDARRHGRTEAWMFGYVKDIFALEGLFFFFSFLI